MNEYKDGEIPEEDNEIKKEEQQEIKEESDINDFKPTLEEKFEERFENFEIVKEIEQSEASKKFEPSYEFNLNQSFTNFELKLNENHSFEINGRQENFKSIASRIDSIISDLTLSSSEKTKILEDLKNKVLDNPDLPFNEKQGYTRAIESEIIRNSGVFFDKNVDSNKVYNKPKNEIKNLELSETNIDYKNLFEESVQNTFKKYFEKTEKYPNYGITFRKDFIEWVEKIERNSEIFKKINEIKENEEILKFIRYKISSTSESQSKILKALKDKRIKLSHGTIKKVSLIDVYNNDLEKYKKRFQSDNYSRIPEDIRTSIIQRIHKEVKKVNPDSLYKISKDFPEVSDTTIIKIAKEQINNALFLKTWPPAFNEISQEKKENILKTLDEEFNKEKPKSLKKISKEFNISAGYVQNLARERYPEQYNMKWSAIQKYSTEIKEEIKEFIIEETLKDFPRTLKEISEFFPDVGYDTIKRIAKENIPIELYDKIWAPICRKVPEEIRIQVEKCLKNEIRKANPRSFSKIGKDFDVSREYIRKTALQTFPKTIYSKIWEPSLKPLNDIQKREVIDYIKNTSLNLNEIADKTKLERHTISAISQNMVFNNDIKAHEIRFPKDLDCLVGTYTHKNINSLVSAIVQNNSNSKYFAEPRIYQDGRTPDGFIPEYNKYLYQRLNNTKNGKELTESLKLTPSFIENIKGMQFDYTNDLSYENILEKIEKYQSKDTILFIVGTKWDFYDNIIEVPQDDLVKYPENIKIINHELFADFINISGNDRDIFDKIIQLNQEKALDALKIFYMQDLSLIKTYNANDLKNELIQYNLIKNDIDEYFSFIKLKSKEEVEKQLKLDYFLNS
ncbi:MAG: hypothetical protein ACFFDH_02385 [Promethearchaeota archaeon]